MKTLLALSNGISRLSMFTVCALLRTTEGDLMPFAPSAEEPLLPLSLEEPFLAAAEKAMVSAVQSSLKEAETLRHQLDEVAATLRASAALPIDAEGKVNLAELGAKLESFQQAENRLRTLTTRVVARIFLVDGEKAKGMLRTRVNNLKDDLCNQALAWVENEVSSLHKAWEVALSKASMVPASEQELVELKRYLAVVHQETAPLIARGQTLSNLMSLLEQHFVFAALRVQKQAFELDCCPMKLKMALCETNGILDLAKERVGLLCLVGRKLGKMPKFGFYAIESEKCRCIDKHCFSCIVVY